ncbi:uncharacterized protein LOC123523349 [Mercenaria mercenaria]|uniref:uncharacterized protein LOC123523349 n=1 Tax=Mercenaria mercenaria TaxID=6596 RepID=UPI00234F8F68|nr:uncharacterized protein LOC123523349 [Mercenaria mercenaria]
MAPILRQGELCFTSYNISTDRNTNSKAGTDNYSEEDKHALLYIVCTLLFYSLGIMIGIVSYIKREKQDIEQEKMFDDFLTSFRGETEAVHYRQFKVQETIERLAEIERADEKSFDDFNAGKVICGRKKHLYKFANVSFIQAPVVKVNSMTSVATGNEQERDAENFDPFFDRRLSEVVAEMIADKYIENRSKTMTNNLNVKENKDNKNKSIDCDRAIENKDLCKESLRKAESDLYYDKMVLEKDTSSCCNEATLPHDKLQPEYPQDDSVYHSIKTNTGRIIETTFGVNVYQENLNITPGEQLNKEANFGKGNKQRDLTFKWSVTSV